MPSVAPLLVLFVELLLPNTTMFGQQAITDPSLHKSATVTVNGVRVPYLDWGGKGMGLVFSAGFGNSAHVFDDFAPRFVDRFHVIGVTRVGFGEADQPMGKGYDLASRVEHIREVLDAAAISKAVLVGHSLGGDEITAFAVRYPNRVSGLIYLDAGMDHRAPLRWQDAAFREVASIEPRPTRDDLRDVYAYRKYYGRMIGVELPLGEMLAITSFDAAGAVRGQRASRYVIEQTRTHVKRPEFAKVRVRVLALYSDGGATEQFPWLVDHPVESARVTTLLIRLGPEIDAERAKFARAIPGATIQTYRAHHYQFLSVPDDTERRMRAFLSSVTP